MNITPINPPPKSISVTSLTANHQIHTEVYKLSLADTKTVLNTAIDNNVKEIFDLDS